MPRDFAAPRQSSEAFFRSLHPDESASLLATAKIGIAMSFLKKSAKEYKLEWPTEPLTPKIHS